jgi:membrane-bound lytic murein transglycosylase A
MFRVNGSWLFNKNRNQIAIAATLVLIEGFAAQAVGLSAHAAAVLERNSQVVTSPPAIFGPSTTQPEPLRLPDTALEPVDWNVLKGWSTDDHAAAFATFLASCARSCEAASAWAKSVRCIPLLSRCVGERLAWAD